MINFLKNILFCTEQSVAQIHIFSWYHLALFLGAFAAFHYIIHKQEISNRTEGIAKFTTLFVLGLHITCYIWYHFSDLNLFTHGLPLYTCRMVLYLFIAGIFFKKEKCLKLATYWGVYGGIAGLVFPTIYKYPFPHILQITTFVLHVYIFLLGSYYLFVKKIGMNLKESAWCCKITAGLILFNSIFNIIFESNYISTRRMPAHLINYLGMNLPDFLCLPAVIIGYVAVTYFQWWAANKTIRYQENKNKCMSNNECKNENVY